MCASSYGPFGLKRALAPPLPIQDATEAAAESGDCDSSDESSNSAASSQHEDRGIPEVNWLLTNGKKGCLHIQVDGGEHNRSRCGRALRRPESGTGIEQALATGHVWSPRCFECLPEQAKAWWRSAHDCEP